MKNNMHTMSSREEVDAELEKKGVPNGERLYLVHPEDAEYFVALMKETHPNVDLSGMELASVLTIGKELLVGVITDFVKRYDPDNLVPEIKECHAMTLVPQDLNKAPLVVMYYRKKKGVE